MDFLVDDNDSQEEVDHDDSQSNDSQGVSDDDSQSNDSQEVADDDSQGKRNSTVTLAIRMCREMLEMDLSVTLANQIKVFKSELQLAEVSLGDIFRLDEHIIRTWDVHIRSWVNHVEKYLQHLQFQPIRNGRMHDDLFEQTISNLLQLIDVCPTIDDIYKCLEELENQGEFENYHIQKLKLELRNLRIHLKWRAYSFDEESDYHHISMELRSWVRYVKERLFPQLKSKKGILQLTEQLEETLYSLSHIMTETKMEFSKENCRWIDELPFNFDYPNALITDLQEWIDQLLDNVKHLIQWNKLSSVISIKEQNETWVEKVGFLRKILQIAGMELEEVIKNGKPMLALLHKTSENLLTRMKMLIYKATYKSWYILDDSEPRSLEKFFLASLANIDHIEPEIRMTCVQLLKGSKIANPRTLGIDLQALATMDSLLDNLQKLLKDQDNGSFMHLDVHEIEILCQKLCFVKYFLMDPHVKQHNEIEALLIQVEADAWELGTLLTEDHMPYEMQLVHANLLKNLNRLKIKIREMYLRIPRQSTSNFPRSPKLGFVNFFIQSLEELLQHRANSIAYVKREVKTLLSELTLSNFFIRNSTKNFEKNDSIARDIVNVAYEAEQVIDLISASHFPKWYYILWLSDVIEKIKKLKEDCPEVLKIACEISNMKIDSSTSNSNQAYNMAIEEEMVGFDAEAQRIIDQLIGGTKHLDIVSIVGMPGLGKTTLAKKIYEHSSITRYFHIRSWYCISQEYDIQDLLCSILNDLPQRLPEKDDQDRAQELYKSLKGRRYLIVLDDIWSIEPWNDVRSSFPDDNNGSRILFTSRSREVALQANPRSALPHDLRLLSDEEGWELFHNKVFKQRRYPPEIYTIGKKIVVNCKGLPLSVVLVAGVVVKLEESEDHWKQVLESLGKQVVDLSKCVLELSYNQLPDHLKPCFLYLGAFPVDREIPTSKLIRLWIAEGFIQKKTEHERLENVAEVYLMDLISRSLVLIAQRKSNGGIKSCHVHDLLHEFSVEKAKDENFFMISKEMACDHGQYRLNFSNMPAFDSRIPYVRTVFSYPRSDFWVFSYDLKLLKVLNLTKAWINNDQFQRLTEVLLHLRYLEIGGEIDHVPSSVANLWRLETLILKKIWNKKVLELPEALLEMAYLIHVYVNGEARFEFSGDPEKSIKSACIEKFSTLRVDHEDLDKVMRRLRNLRKLKCVIVNTKNQNITLDFLSKLESLNMKYIGESKRNTLSGFRFPTNLKKLTLSWLRLPWSEISKIKRLPQLKVLKLLWNAFTGPRWDANDDDEVWNLKVLKLRMLDIEEWDASPDVFPCLEKLVVSYCEQLKEIPSSFGVSSTLQMIEVTYCMDSVEEAVLKIGEEQRELGATGFKVVIHY